MNRRVVGAVIGVFAVAVAVVLYLALGKPAARDTDTADGVASGSGATTKGGTSATPGRASIHGHVTDAKGPIAGASVCADDRAELSRCAMTDATGGYAIENLSARTYRVSASAPQHRPATYSDREVWVRLASSEARDKIDLSLRAGVLLSGTVQDINGGPIAGARVRARASDSRETLGIITNFWWPPTTSGRDGAFQLWVAPGDESVSASADGYAEGTVDANAPTSVVILLMPEGSIAGTVVDAQGHAVPDARVVSHSVKTQNETRTDANGAFFIGHLVADRYEVDATTPNGFGTSAGDVVVALGRPTAGVEIHVIAAARISGRVMLGDAPCPDPLVHLFEPRTERTIQTISDGGGAVHVDGVLPTEYVVHPECTGGYEGGAPYARLVVTEKDQSDLVWHVNVGATIRGRVTTAAGAPLADVTVEAKDEWSEDATTDDDGRYTIVGLRPGNYTVTATALDGNTAEASIALKDAQAATLDLQVETSSRIAGTVVDAAGRPVAGLEVRADPKDEKRAEGTSVWDEKAEGGVFDMAVHPGAYHVYAAVDWQHPIAPGVDATVVAGQRVTVQIKVPAQDGVIKGKVVDSTGGAIGDAVVTASTAGMFDTFTIGWNEHPVLTSADGTFAITGLGPGEYNVTAQRPGAPSTTEKGVQPGADVTLTIVAAGTVSGVVAYADGKHPREIVVSVRDKDRTFYRTERFLATNGAFHLDELAAAPLDLAVTDPEHGFVATAFTLAPGEAKKDLSLVLGRTVPIRGRIVDAATKQPVANQPVYGESKQALLSTMTSYDDFLHLTGADGRFAIQVPTGAIEIRAMSLSMKKRENCTATLETSIEGALADVGDIELVCKHY